MTCQLTIKLIELFLVIQVVWRYFSTNLITWPIESYNQLSNVDPLRPSWHWKPHFPSAYGSILTRRHLSLLSWSNYGWPTLVTSHCIYPLDSYHVIQMWELLSLQPSLLNQLSTLLGIGTIFRTCLGVIATPFELQCFVLITLNLGQIVPHFASLHFFPTS